MIGILTTIGSSVASAVATIGPTVANFCTNVLPRILPLIEKAPEVLRVVATIAQVVLQVVNIFKPMDDIQDIGHRAIQAGEQGTRPEKAPGLSPWVIVFNALIFVELLWQPSRIASAWVSTSKNDVWRLGNTLILRIERAGEQPISLPLHTITTMMINAAWGSPIPSYLECVVLTSSWVSSLTPHTRWASEPDTFMRHYSDIAHAHHVIRLPPWLITAGNTEMEAAALSLSSISRIAYGRPGLSGVPERKAPRRSTNASNHDLLSQVIRIVNHMGDNSKRHGEDGASKAKLAEKILEWKSTCGVSYGIGVDVWDWIVEECRKRKSKKSYLEVSSMATYLSRLRPFLEAVGLEDGLEDLCNSQWEDGRRLVLGELTGDSRKQASSIFRHFARFWRTRGCIAISHDFIRDNIKTKKELASPTTLPVPT